ncbi:MAG: hypothetical protein QOG89_2399 [Thermomicrobiales bacterium]|nr:hypothetical protein [Thermomicrobiales bacterium]
MNQRFEGVAVEQPSLSGGAKRAFSLRKDIGDEGKSGPTIDLWIRGRLPVRDTGLYVGVHRYCAPFLSESARRRVRALSRIRSLSTAVGMRSRPVRSPRRCIRRRSRIRIPNPLQKARSTGWEKSIADVSRTSVRFIVAPFRSDQAVMYRAAYHRSLIARHRALDPSSHSFVEFPSAHIRIRPHLWWTG